MANMSKLKLAAKDLQHVKINEKNIQNLLKYQLQLGNHWLEDPAYRLSELNQEDLFLFILILDSTSFSYWGEPNWQIYFKSKKINGARAMILALRRAVDNGTLILNAKFLSKLSREKYRKILKGTCEIPLFEERFQIIRELGKTLLEKYQGKVSNLLQGADNDALKLIDLLAYNFSFFEDHIVYEDQKIHFNKKAQLFALDIARTKLVDFKNINELTACADYKLPQVLRRLGIFEYSSHLAKLIDKNIPLPKESIEEIEIRIKTILAVERIKKLFQNRRIKTQSFEINDLLWLLGQKKSQSDKPYHKTRSTKY